MSDTSSPAGRIPFPLAFLGLALFFGAMRFEGFRPLGARFVGLALPVATVWAAQSKLVDTHPALRRAALALGAVVLGVAGHEVARVLLGFHSLSPHPETYRLVLVAVGLGAVVLEGLAARRSLRVRIAAWFGIALGFAGYLAGVEPGLQKQQLGLVFVASLVGLWAGGLGGLVLGAAAARLARAPAKDVKTPPAPSAGP
jgi:hypothetical protein